MQPTFARKITHNSNGTSEQNRTPLRCHNTDSNLHHSAYTPCHSTHPFRPRREPRTNELSPPETVLVMMLAG